MTLSLRDPVDAIDGIGRRYAARLADKLAIRTVEDLITHFPFRYDDLGDVQSLDTVVTGDKVTLIGTVLAWEQFRPGRRKLTISQADVRDQLGGRTFAVTFFNQPWRRRQLPPGTVATFSGELVHKFEKHQIQMPTFHELAGPDDHHAAGLFSARGPDAPAELDQRLDHTRQRPVYQGSEHLPSWRLERWIAAALDELPALDDFLADRHRRHHDLVDLDAAVRNIHAPADRQQEQAARRRLVFDELFTLQVGLQWRRQRLRHQLQSGDNRPLQDGLAQRFLDALPFEATAAQRRVMDEVGADLGDRARMHRLLQGDVGSGKTLVAVWTMLCAVDRARQAVMMAPTEVLAEQHYRTLCDQLAPLGVNVLDGVRVELLTSATTKRQRRRILGELMSGRIDLVVGTHALLEEGVRFQDLGVVVIDEQHRFGVHQRLKLREKVGDAPGPATYPDVLVMTATPIPRSLALTLFGDLDVSVLDELPPGRGQIKTALITSEQAHRREKLYDFIREQAADGLQAYIVCPLVEESEELAARAAVVEHERLRTEVFEDLTVGLVHGRLSAEAKEAAMGAFRRGETQVLVTTTVIEVGVDVPAATVMVIEDADRFGISQLHQLRGRVGRSSATSYCVLFAGFSDRDVTDAGHRRLQAVASTTDGFRLAEIDLRLRGEGELLGARQSGMPDFKLARLARDRKLVEETRDAARELVAADPDLTDPDNEPLRTEVHRRYGGDLDELEALGDLDAS